MTGKNAATRCIGISLAAISLVAAASDANEYPQKSDTTSQAIATASDKLQHTRARAAVEVSTLDRPCASGVDARSSDLCAQWKAADAAKASTDWAGLTFWLGVVGTVIGGFTLLAAGFAAKFARDAAMHTDRGSKEAARSATASEEALGLSKHIASTDLRAWVSIDLELVGAGRSEKNASLDVKIIVKNLGRTPATRFRGQSLTVGSVADSRLAFGGNLGRADRRYRRRMGSDRGASAA